MRVHYSPEDKKILWSSSDDPNLTIPCRQCVGCRLERSRIWAVRVMHEAQLYSENSYITLTYAPEHLKSPSLEYEDFQLFMKRLRKRFTGKTIRFYMCGEYGEQNRRPHFHACIFNLDFQDKVFHKTENGFPVYTSPTLSQLWPFGFSTVGSLTFRSAAYVARYIMKKQTGDGAVFHYLSDEVDPETGEITPLTPEFNKMSLKPGIGQKWIEKYMDDVYPHDYVVINGHKTRPPAYYDQQYQKVKGLSAAAELEIERFERALKHEENNTPERLAVREKISHLKLKKLKRTL